MNHMTKIAPYSVLALLVMMVAGQQVQAATPATVSAGVDSLAYHLVDLDPNDGIAPSVSFNFSNEDVSVYGPDSKTATFTPFSTNSLKLTTSNGSTLAKKAGSNYVTQTAATLNDLTGPAQVSYAQNFLATPDLFASAYNSVALFDSAYRLFTLSPHTQLVIDGISKSNISFDQNQLLQTDLANLIQASPNATFVMYIESQITISAFDADSNSFAELGAGGRVDYQIDKTGLQQIESFRPYVGGDHPFSLVINNDGAAARDGYLSFGVESAIGTYLTQAVPEPSTWALYTLGLAGCAFAARRRRM
jgi:PEP-CTERM motif